MVFPEIRPERQGSIDACEGCEAVDVWLKEPASRRYESTNLLFLFIL